MRDARDLRYQLDAIDRRGYPAYKGLRGCYRFEGYELGINHVQGDPFAAPSDVSVYLTWDDAAWPEGLRAEPWRARAFADCLLRRFGRAARRYSFKVAGSGKSGALYTSKPGPEVLERSACVLGERGFELCFKAGFPAHGRTVDAGALRRMLFDFVPRIVDEALTCDAQGLKEAQAACDLADDQHFIREELERLGLVAFVADDSVLPRESGASSRPMRGASPFRAPDSQAVVLDLPHRGPMRGMGVRRGVTLVVGGGYHGKSTFLQALQEGVYDHVAGDGREYVICDAAAVKLRAEDRRAVHGVDISLYINNLPTGADTHAFSTADASGSTSQAASAVEAVEAGCKALLIDEDTSATNFMVRDELMAAVVSPEQEPITPFVERVRDLWEQAGVSSVIVAGSSGAFFGVADTVIQMERYEAFDITDRVRRICAERGEGPARRAPEFALPAPHCRLLDVRAGGSAAGRLPSRETSDAEGADAVSGATGRATGHGRGGDHVAPGACDRRLKVRSSRDEIQVGEGGSDLRLVEQLVDSEQAAALAQMMRLALTRGLLDGRHALDEVLRALYADLDECGWEGLDEHGTPSCGLAMPRPQELAATLNRWRA